MVVFVRQLSIEKVPGAVGDRTQLRTPDPKRHVNGDADLDNMREGGIQVTTPRGFNCLRPLLNRLSKMLHQVS